MHFRYLSSCYLPLYTLCVATLSQYLSDSRSTIADKFFAPGDIFGVSPQRTRITHHSRCGAAGFSLVVHLPLTFAVFFSVADFPRATAALHSPLGSHMPTAVLPHHISLSYQVFLSLFSFIADLFQFVCTLPEGPRGHFETSVGFRTDFAMARSHSSGGPSLLYRPRSMSLPLACPIWLVGRAVLENRCQLLSLTEPRTYIYDASLETTRDTDVMISVWELG
jgi:hypothetical protein